MSTKETVLTILAVVLGVCLTGGGVYAIGLAVQVYMKFPDEPVTSDICVISGTLGVLALIGGVLLLRRLLKRP